MKRSVNMDAVLRKTQCTIHFVDNHIYLKMNSNTALFPKTLHGCFKQTSISKSDFIHEEKYELCSKFSYDESDVFDGNTYRNFPKLGKYSWIPLAVQIRFVIQNVWKEATSVQCTLYPTF